MNDSTIGLAAFDSRFSAELLSARLTSEGIENFIKTDEVYGKMTSGTHSVVVNKDDLVQASTMLSEIQDEPAAPKTRLHSPRLRLIMWLILGAVVGIPVVVNIIVWLQ